MLLKISALFLWYFTLVFLLAVFGSNIPLLKEDTFLGDILIRRPYQFDFELMFTVLYFVWGIFLWKSSKESNKNSNFVSFTGWTFLTQAIVMVILAFLQSRESLHFIFDSIPWFILGALLFRSK